MLDDIASDFFEANKLMQQSLYHIAHDDLLSTTGLNSLSPLDCFFAFRLGHFQDVLTESFDGVVEFAAFAFFAIAAKHSTTESRLRESLDLS